ncbi:MAG TPA: penicillin-binding transpeptidase domain-containing protein [Anaerolineae bacterium]
MPLVTATDYPEAINALVNFVKAVNTQDFTRAYALLDTSTTQKVPDAATLKRLYIDTYNTATALQVTYTLKSGLLQDGPVANALLVSEWRTILFGQLFETATLSMTYQNNTWHVAWTKDLIFPGLSSAILALQRDIPQRGAIYASDGSPLAALGEAMTIGIRQTEIRDSADEIGMLKALSRVLGVGTSAIKARYKDQPEDWWVPIAEVDADTMNKYAASLEPFPAIIARPHSARLYPQGSLAPHVVGYVGAIPTNALSEYRLRGYAGNELVGLSGVEGYMDSTLAGSPGGSLQLITSDGVVTEIANKPFVPGQDITLALSPTVQISLQKILGNRRGAAIVMNPMDGSIIAMASFPTFDNSILGQSGKQDERQSLIKNPEQPLLNRATQGTYPAGSTFKMVTMAAGMGEGVTSPKDVFYDPGYWDGLGGRYRKTCWLRSGHGQITLQDGLTASCDTVFYTVGKRLDDKGSALLAQYARQFGFGAVTGIDLTEEATGIMPDPDWKKSHVGEVWTPGDTVNLAIGQGFMLATPLQVNQMTAAIANGGTVVQPHVVASISGSVTVPPRTIGRTDIRKLPVSTEGLTALQSGMIGVTTNPRIGTTNWRFADFDYYMMDGNIVSGKGLTSAQRSNATRFVVAGKSGTAQAPGANDKPFAWFTAYVPANNPQIAVTVMLENAGEGSGVAAPLVRQIIE